MGLLLKGITRLSELDIDADKVWEDAGGNPRGITNIKEVAALMAKGALAEHNGTKLIPFYPSLDGYVVTSQGPGKLLTYAPAGGGLKYYFPVSIDSAHAEAIVPVDQSYNKNAALTSDHKEAYGDSPADLIKLLSPSISLADAQAVLAGPDQSFSKTPIIKSALSILCDGFVEETALGVQTDHTAEARDPTANDLNLNPMTDTVLDKIYIGSNYPFWQVQTMVGTTGVGNWTNSWYYWNGAWVPVVNEQDGTNEWQYGAGLGMMSHTPQGDWALSTIQGMNLYWVMSRTDNFVSRVTKPLGSQIWVAIA